MYSTALQIKAVTILDHPLVAGCWWKFLDGNNPIDREMVMMEELPERFFE